MGSDTPLIEYLIIGAHTSLWVIIVALTLLGKSPTMLQSPDAGLLVLALPFVYLLGMLSESVSHLFLRWPRNRIKNKHFADVPREAQYQYQDEYIALKSPTLYEAYETRVRRVRVIGAAIFNWPLLGFAIWMWRGFTETWLDLALLISTVVMWSVSMFAWSDLYNRAFSFRRNACEQIIRAPELAKEPVPVS